LRPLDGLDFRWDPEKARTNAKNHKVTFEEASTVFADPLSSDIPDPDHSDDDERFIKIGTSHQNRLLTISYAEDEIAIRLINARKSSRPERRDYEER
jgi:uncharacterized DUF497 family protein